jgi:DNA-binding transcriptional ArsR family regulator
MRPLYHPPVEEITVEGILYALSDPVRASILMQLAGAEDARCCSTFLNISHTPLAKSTLSQHFKILREAGLIRSERKGVELQNRTRCSERKKTFGPMINEILATYRKIEKRR